MKTQRLIALYDLRTWSEVVNSYLERGWYVVPGTLQLSTSVQNNNLLNNTFAVVVERDSPETKK